MVENVVCGANRECGQSLATSLFIIIIYSVISFVYTLIRHAIAIASWVRYETNEYNECDENKKKCSKYGTIRAHHSNAETNSNEK